MSQLWKVVGGAVSGGIIVRTGKELTSDQEALRLSWGAVLQEDHLAGSRLQYTKLTGSGPETGWVSTTQKDKPLVLRIDQQEAYLLATSLSFARSSAVVGSESETEASTCTQTQLGSSTAAEAAAAADGINQCPPKVEHVQGRHVSDYDYVRRTSYECQQAGHRVRLALHAGRPLILNPMVRDQFNIALTDHVTESTAFATTARAYMELDDELKNQIFPNLGPDSGYVRLKGKQCIHLSKYQIEEKGGEISARAAFRSFQQLSMGLINMLLYPRDARRYVGDSKYAEALKELVVFEDRLDILSVFAYSQDDTCPDHIDRGLLTLVTNAQGGLQVQDPALGWIDVPLTEGLVAFAGLMLQEATKGEVPAVRHRVLNAKGRLSVAFKLRPPMHAFIGDVLVYEFLSTLLATLPSINREPVCPSSVPWSKLDSIASSAGPAPALPMQAAKLILMSNSGKIHELLALRACSQTFRILASDGSYWINACLQHQIPWLLKPDQCGDWAAHCASWQRKLGAWRKLPPVKACFAGSSASMFKRDFPNLKVLSRTTRISDAMRTWGVFRHGEVLLFSGRQVSETNVKRSFDDFRWSDYEDHLEPCERTNGRCRIGSWDGVRFHPCPPGQPPAAGVDWDPFLGDLAISDDTIYVDPVIRID